MQLSPAIPILRSFSEAKAREFYVDFLGFEVAWEHRFEPDAPLYMELRRGTLTLHLSEHHGDGSPGMTLLVQVDGLDALHAELNARQYRNMRPGIEARDWGREMTVWDPFGNRIRFTAE
ncbi:bleomycin resistance protein [Massilia sp. Root351]|jgi:catechol 2,3-dioxygenase-like lactoylglutathione lyase family enzyme|uniref:glyoxalase superfamily protein n=1 Tax=Massilia sp. Root351 TaxID=1736522 RepID=UPI00070CAA9D|nr:glyoxalase superfamily protein [Massilia sp. Root351]KQV79019.1 bleomycin resistance protein [Massilia sp. Root351]